MIAGVSLFAWHEHQLASERREEQSATKYTHVVAGDVLLFRISETTGEVWRRVTRNWISW